MFSPALEADRAELSPSPHMNITRVSGDHWRRGLVHCLCMGRGGNQGKQVLGGEERETKVTRY